MFRFIYGMIKTCKTSLYWEKCIQKIAMTALLSRAEFILTQRKDIEGTAEKVDVLK